MRKYARILIIVAVLYTASFVYAGGPAATWTFTLSMERPTAHYFQVELRADGLTGETQDFKLPSWTPGYYRIQDYARNVINFRAADGNGRPLSWEKTAKNVWRVQTGRAASAILNYDVYAFSPGVADSYLDDSRAFVCPAGVFMHAAGRLGQSSTVVVRPLREGSRVASGLDPLEGKPNAFFAPDFDTLYDCPILVGDLEILSFEVRGVPHEVAAVDLGTLDRRAFVADLAKIVEGAAALIGEIPYSRYVFLLIGPGGGGLEHMNSSALTFNPAGLAFPAGYKSWLSFVSHEFYHLYNVKRIRPIALGPFDYDRENYTNLLWVSEGISVYYEDIILNRVGLMTRDEILERFRSFIARYENVPGRLFQSATASSFDTWLHFFDRSENAANTTISYYDKGAALGLLLDLKIRHETQNRASLDDVMRTLYRTFYKEKKRGFTDKEFREACERTAGTSLAEIFDVCAATVKEIDYPRYLAYAGLAIDVRPVEKPGAFFGAAVQDQGGRATVSTVEWDSPAWRAGLSAQDEILAVDGKRVSARTLDEILAARKPSDTVKVLISRRNAVKEIEVLLGARTERSFRITPLLDPQPLQAAILRDWLKLP